MLFSSGTVQLFFAIVVTAEAIAADLQNGDPCVTPNEENSTCVPFVSCGVLLAAALDPTPETSDFLKKSKCSDKQLVCCGSSASSNKPPSSPEAEQIVLSFLSDETICGLDAVLGEKIQGGKVAKLEEFPWLAALEYKSAFDNTNAGIRCGGSLISNWYILTAAHCIHHVEFVITKVWLGATNISSNENCLNLTGTLQCANSIQKCNVSKVYSHESYNSSLGTNDIGLLRLGNRVSFTNYIRPICLPWSDSLSPKPGIYMTVAGWGATENNRTSELKLKVDVPVQDDSICNKFLASQGRIINSNQLCVGGETGKDSCQGDSGGPLMNLFNNEDLKIQWYQAGIVSYGVGCGINQRPSIYTKVSAYGQWIAIKIDELDSKLDKSDACTTPNGSSGSCVPLNTCEVVYNAVSAKNRRVLDFATRSYCGRDHEILVCCESPGSVIVPTFETKALPDQDVCGVVKEQSKILGSEIAEIGEFPWMVHFEYKVKDDDIPEVLCAGSLINNRYVLTSAECLSYDPPINAWLGDWKMSTDPDCKKLSTYVKCADPVKKIPVMKVIGHPFYDSMGISHNIGLVLLKHEVQFTDYISPICLPFPNIPPPEIGTLLSTARWGSTENDTRSDVLRKDTTLLVSNDGCNRKWVDIDYFMNSPKLCDYNWAGKHCDEFEGNPLIRTYENKSSGKMQWYQEGITSVRLTCENKTYPSVYAPVSSHMSWIIRVISEE